MTQHRLVCRTGDHNITPLRTVWVFTGYFYKIIQLFVSLKKMQESAKCSQKWKYRRSMRLCGRRRRWLTEWMTTCLSVVVLWLSSVDLRWSRAIRVSDEIQLIGDPTQQFTSLLLRLLIEWFRCSIHQWPIGPPLLLLLLVRRQRRGRRPRSRRGHWSSIWMTHHKTRSDSALIRENIESSSINRQMPSNISKGFLGSKWTERPKGLSKVKETDDDKN